MKPQPATQPPAHAEGEHFYVSLPESVLAVGERRLDAETYLTGGYGMRAELEGTFSCRPMAELAAIWQPPRLAGISVAREDGVPFLAATQVFDVRPVPRRFLAPSRTPNLDRRFVDEGWILVTCSGTVGDAIMAYSPLKGKVISHDLLRVVVDAEPMRSYLYAFLRTRHARLMLRSTKYGSIVKHLEPEHLFDIPVPELGDDVMRRVELLVHRAFVQRDLAVALAEEAESSFASHFGLAPEGKADEEIGFSIGSRELEVGRRRLDAHFYNPRARRAAEALEKGAERVTPLGAACESIFGVPRFKHVYTERGIPYFDSEDLFKVNPELTKFIPHVTKRDSERYYVRRGWLLMASSGQIYGLNGNVILATKQHERAIVSNHVLRIVPMSVDPGYLVAAMSHPSLGRPVVLRAAFGSEVPEIAPDDLAQYPLARLDEAEESNIGALVSQAADLRLGADRSEDAAVAYLERLIDGVVAGESSWERLRAAEYAAAYAERPTTDDERDWATAGAQALLASETARETG